MASTNELYDELLEHWRKATLLASCSSQLSWDEQTYLPPGGAAHRAEQLSLLAGMVHERLTSPRLGELIGELERARRPGRTGRPAARISARRGGVTTAPPSCPRGSSKKSPA